jgi:Sulfotransferase family
MRKLLDKNNYYLHHLDIIESIFPNANYIFIVRDGRDVASSYRRVEKINTQSVYKPKLPQIIDDIAIEWNTNNQKVINFFSGIDKKRWSTLRYENLLTDTENTLCKICDFLEINFNVQMLNFYNANKKLNLEPSETLDWKSKTLEPLDVKNIGRYKLDLKADEISRFEIISSEMMSYFGYA